MHFRYTATAISVSLFKRGKVGLSVTATKLDLPNYKEPSARLGREHARTAHRLDLLLRQLGELLGLDDDGLLRELALAKHLEDTLVKSGGGAG